MCESSSIHTTIVWCAPVLNLDVPIQVTNFPGFLHHLLLLWESVRTENGTRKMSNLDYKLQQRLQALFDKWRPLLIEDTRANRRWSRKEREYLEYIDDIEKASE